MQAKISNTNPAPSSPKPIVQLLNKLTEISKINELPAKYWAFNSLWNELINNPNNTEVISVFYSRNDGVTSYIDVCRILRDYSTIDTLLKGLNCGNGTIINQPQRELDLYFNWLWLAANEPDNSKKALYLGHYKNIYTTLQQYSFTNNVAKLCVEQARIDENLFYAIQKVPAPNSVINNPVNSHDRNIPYRFLLQEYFNKINSKQAINTEDYNKIAEGLLNVNTGSAAPVLGRTLVYFKHHGLINELSMFLETLHKTIIDKKNSNNNTVEFNWHHLAKHWLVHSTIWVVRVGLVNNKDRLYLDNYIRITEEIVNTKYDYSKLEKGELVHYTQKRVIAEGDTRLDSLSVLIANTFMPHDFMEAQDSKSGEDMLLNARNLMNPYNRNFNVKKAIELIKQGINLTPQVADLFIEYIRAQLILDANYYCQKDPFMHKFFRSKEHVGYLWHLLLPNLFEYTNEYELLLRVEAFLKDRVSMFKNAYANPQTVSFICSIKEFDTAFGSVQEMLKTIEAFNKKYDIHQNTPLAIALKARYERFAADICAEMVVETNSKNETVSTFSLKT